MSTYQPRALCPNVVQDFTYPGTVTGGTGLRYICHLDGCPLSFQPIMADVYIGDPRCLVTRMGPQRPLRPGQTGPQ